MDQLEFSIAIHLVRKKLQGVALPKVLPASMKVDPGTPGVTSPVQQQQLQASATAASQAVPAAKPAATPPQQTGKNAASVTAPPLSKSMSVYMIIAAFINRWSVNVTVIEDSRIPTVMSWNFSFVISRLRRYLVLENSGKFLEI